MTSAEKHNRMANAIRFLSMDAIEKANSGTQACQWVRPMSQPFCSAVT